MAKTIFRKIGHRIIPIIIGSKSLGENANTKVTTLRRITAHINGEQIGRVDLVVPKIGNRATIAYAAVEQKFQNSGIGKAMYEHAMKLLSRAKKEFLHSEEIINPAVIKVRSSLGPSKFIAHGVGKNGRSVKILSPEKAVDYATKVMKQSPHERGFTGLSGVTKIKGKKKP